MTVEDAALFGFRLLQKQVESLPRVDHDSKLDERPTHV